MKDLKVIVSDNIRKYRQRRGMTQAELAAKCGLDVRYVNRVENLPQNVGLEHLQRIADGLNIAPVQLVVEKFSTSYDESAIDSIIQQLNNLKKGN